MKWKLLTFLLPIMCIHVIAQNDSLDYYKFIDIDTIYIRSKKPEFDIDKFMQIAKDDTSFYIAFKNLRNHAFKQNIDVMIKHNHESRYAYYESNMKYIGDSCYRLFENRKIIDPKLLKSNGDYKYLTMELFHQLFLPDNELCRELSIYQPIKKSQSRYDYYKNELKKLLFMTGTSSDILFMKEKTSIFSPQMRKYYHYSIETDQLLENEAIVFTISLNHQYENANKNTVINYLKTWYSLDNFTVLKRQYHLKYSTLLYEFDVKMDIAINEKQGVYYPKYVSYDGIWKVPFKKREISHINIKIEDFKTQQYE